MQVGGCSDLKFNHNSGAPGSDSSDVSTEGSNQREVSVSASAPDEQQPSKYGIIIFNLSMNKICSLCCHQKMVLY